MALLMFMIMSLVVEHYENHMVVKLILMMTARPGAPFQSCKTWSTHLGTEEEEEGGVVVVRYNILKVGLGVGGGGGDTAYLQALLNIESQT